MQSRIYLELLSDDEVLSEHYSFVDDINLDSLKAYRNLFTAFKADHAFLEEDLFDFFKLIGGWRKDRETGKQGITVAGILMFGTWDAITATRPNYFVDYQERPEAKTEQRWIDRIHYDGTWSGNLFDFYRKVYQKLTADLKVPFNIEDGQRKNDTPVHIALREALINCIVHADFSERVPILIVKRPDLFGFRNPGLMRIPLEDVIAGGTSGLSVSDCRNQTLQSMFLLIGLSERAGSGIPKIFSGWRAVNWRKPKLQERLDPAQTILELNTASLIPEETKEQLHKIFGEKFYQLNELETNIVVTAAIENWINHERACELTSEHARDVTLALPRLVQKGFLTPVGESKHKFYTLPGISVATPDQVFANALTSIVPNITHSESIITHNEMNITHSDNRDIQGRLVTDLLVKPIIDDLEKLDSVLLAELQEIAKPTLGRARLSKEQMIQIIIELCTDQYIEIAQLAILLSRTSQNIRQNYLKLLVENKTLSLAFPQTPTTKRQAYTRENP